MKKIVVLILVLVLSLGVSVSYAAKKKAVKKKASVAKKSQVKLYAIGTAQMPGEWCNFGQAYTIGKHYPMNLTINSAQFSIGRVTVGTNTFYALPEEKLLIIRFMAHNPKNYEQSFSSSSFKWTVVDAKNANHEAEPYFGVLKSNEELSITLKPAQKIEGFCFFKVPAKGPVPKLIVQSGIDEDAPVARYDLVNKVKPLPAELADPSDPLKVSALPDTPAVMGQVYQANEFDFRVDNLEYASAPPSASLQPEEGRAYAVITMWLKNKAASGHVLFPYGWDFKLKAKDGSEAEWSQNAVSASSNNEITLDMNPGDENQVRTYFTMPSGTTYSTLSVSFNGSRTYTFKL